MTSPLYAQQMEANGVTCAGMVVWGGYGSDMNSVYNEFASWYQEWMAAYPPTSITMKNRFGAGPTPTPPTPSITFASSPTATTMGPNRTDVFVEGSDTALWHSYYVEGAGMTAWEFLSGSITSQPSAVWMGSEPNELHAFARGADAAVWHICWDGTKWLPWESLNGVLLTGTAPAAVVRGTELDVYVIGQEKGLWRRTLANSVWSSWVEEAKIIK